MKVLHAHSGNLYGGVETLLLTLGQERGATPDVEPHFALCFEGRLSEELGRAGAAVHQLGEVRLSRPWTVRRARRQLRELTEEHGIDVVVCHSVWPQAVFGPAVRRREVPLAFWLHDTATGRGWLQRLAARTPPDLVICNSRFTAGTLPSLYADAAAELVHYPIRLPAIGRAPERVAAIRAALETPDDAVVIVQVSRMEPWKGQHHLLKALGRLREVDGWVCWQVGGAQRPRERRYRESLEQEAERLGIRHRIRFVGERTDVPELLTAADIHCQPNDSPEPFGITFIEALNAGLPVVTYAMGGALEIVDATCGILVPPGDHGALAEALRLLVEDEGERSRLGGAGPARARALCEPEQQMRKLERVFESLSGR